MMKKMNWGVEVKHGVSLRVDPGEAMIVNISNAALGENKDNGNERVVLYLTVGGREVVIGTLSHDKFPQLSMKIKLGEGFELSHSWTNGSVFFSGYKGTNQVQLPHNEDEQDAEDAGDEEVNIQLQDAEDAGDEEVVPSFFTCDWTSNHVFVGFNCSCVPARKIRVFVFRTHLFFCHSEPADGDHQVPAHVVVEWGPEKVSVVSTCHHCYTGCRFRGVSGRSSRFELLR